MTPQQLRDLTRWVDQYAAGVDQLDARVIAAVIAAYAGVNFYSRAEVAAAAQQAADLSNTSQIMAVGLAAEYIAVVTSLMEDEDFPTIPIPLAPIRNGANMTRVFERPVKLFRRQVAKGIEQGEAMRQAMRLAAQITTTNNRLAGRDAFTKAMVRLAEPAGITGYRRVVHPELARTGTCGLCIVASTQVYKTSQLMPMHGGCNCGVLPIIGAVGGTGDPGDSLNNLALGDIYAGAGDSTHGFDLKKLRVVVNEHGEYGPTLGSATHQFTSWDDLGLPAPNAA